MINAIRRRLEDREEGFTLIELLVVVIIIGILAAVAIPVFLSQRDRAFTSAVESDLRNLAVEMETFFTDNSTYVATYANAQRPATGADADTVYFSASDGVTLDIEASDNDAYCLSAAHANLEGDSTPVAWYDSDGGGIVDTSCAGGGGGATP